jgi:hypothetical protein
MVEILFLMLLFHILTNSSNSHSLNQEGLYSHHSSGISLIKKSKLNRKILHIFRSSATKMYNSDKPNWIYVSHVRLILFIFPHIFSAPHFSFCSSCHILDCSDANVFCMLSIYRSFCSAFNLLCKTNCGMNLWNSRFYPKSLIYLPQVWYSNFFLSTSYL